MSLDDMTPSEKIIWQSEYGLSKQLPDYHDTSFAITSNYGDIPLTVEEELKIKKKIRELLEQRIKVLKSDKNSKRKAEILEDLS